MDDKEEFVDELHEKNDPVEQWPTQKLKKEVQEGSEKGQIKERDDLGIE